jgi:hypothetical protein
VNDDIPKDRDTLRAYRLYEARRGKPDQQLMGRWYRWEENAKDAAVVICRRELKVGRVIELRDVRRGKLIEVYRKTVNGGIDIKKSRHLRAEERLRKPVKGDKA